MAIKAVFRGSCLTEPLNKNGVTGFPLCPLFGVQPKVIISTKSNSIA